MNPLIHLKMHLWNIFVFDKRKVLINPSVRLKENYFYKTCLCKWKSFDPSFDAFDEYLNTFDEYVIHWFKIIVWKIFILILKESFDSVLQCT